jgi:hypothetical protein
MLENVPPWVQRVVTWVVGAAIAVVGAKVEGLEDLKMIGTFIVGTGVRHTADMPRKPKAPPPSPPGPPAAA